MRHSVYGRTRVEVAQRLREKMATTATLPTDPSALTLTLAEYMSRVAAGRVGHVSPRTSELDQTFIRYAKASPAGQVTLKNLTGGHLEEWYNALALTHSKSTVQHTRVFVNLALRQAVRRGHLTYHPGLSTELPRMTTVPIAKPLEAEAIVKLLAAAQGTDMYLFLYLALSLGLRHGELLGLQWGDVDERATTLRIERAVTVTANGAATVTAPKTRASRRTLYLTPEHLELLRASRGDAPSTRWIFATPEGGPKNQNNVRRSYRRLLKAAGLDVKTRIHDLRHTFATHLIGAGHDPKTVADLMGHTDPRLTLMIYTHTQDESRKRASLTASELVSPKPQPLPKGKSKPTPKKLVGVG